MTKKRIERLRFLEETLNKLALRIEQHKTVSKLRERYINELIEHQQEYRKLTGHFYRPKDL